VQDFKPRDRGHREHKSVSLISVRPVEEIINKPHGAIFFEDELVRHRLDDASWLRERFHVADSDILRIVTGDSKPGATTSNVMLKIMQLSVPL
jgi:hypothetical protein